MSNLADMFQTGTGDFNICKHR